MKSSAIILLCFLGAQPGFSQYCDYQLIRQELFQHVPVRSNEFIELQSGSASKKNVGLAAIYSLLLPGMGELYVGAYDGGKYFTIAEAALWLTYASFEIYATWLRDDARKFAASPAGVDLSGKNDRFFVDIGTFFKSFQFNYPRYTFSRVLALPANVTSPILLEK